MLLKLKYPFLNDSNKDIIVQVITDLGEPLEIIYYPHRRNDLDFVYEWGTFQRYLSEFKRKNDTHDSHYYSYRGDPRLYPYNLAITEGFEKCQLRR